MAESVVVEARFRDLMSRPLEKVTAGLKKLDRAMDRLRDTSGTRLGRALDKTRTGLGRVERAVGRVARGAARMGRAIGGAMVTGLRRGAIGLAALTGAAVLAANSLVSLAADAGEIQSKFDTVFGESAAAIDEWVATIHRDFGIAKADLRDASSTFGVFGKAAGVAATELPDFSTSLVQAGIDLASFYNVDPGEAFTSLRSGLAGEAEPLRKFGIFLSDATLKAKAATMGLTGELTEAQKVMVRHQLIMEGLGDASGDLARTQDSLSNQQREAAGRWKEIRTVVGTALIPTYEKLYSTLNARLGPATERLGKIVDDLVDPVKAADRSLEGWAVRIDYVLGSGDTLLDLVRDGRQRFEDLRPVIDKVSEVTDDLATIWSDLLQPALADVQDILPFVVSPFVLLDDVIGFIADNTDVLIPLVVALTAAYAVQKTMVMGHNAIMATSNAIRFITTAQTAGLTAAQTAATTSTGALAAGTGVLNAVMSANPIGIVIVVLTALAVALFVAYRRSETFRIGVQRAFTAIKVAGLSMAETIVGAFRSLVNFFLSAAEDLVGGAARIAKALGMDSLAAELSEAQGEIGRFKDGANQRLSQIETNLQIRINTAQAEQAIRNLGSSLNALVAKQGYVDAAVRQTVNRTPGGAGVRPGDTARPRARGGDGSAHANLAATLGRFDTITRGGSGFRVTSGIRDFALGSPGSDHRRGKAIDVQGAFTGRLAQQWRDAGGFAEHHGQGAKRHLHLAAGDTSRPRSGAATGGGVAVTFGDIIVQGGSGDPDAIARKVRREVAAAVRDAVEGR